MKQLQQLKESINFWFFSLVTLCIFSAETTADYLRQIKLSPLPCSGVYCEWHLRFVHPTCLHCRTRRRNQGTFHDPKYYLIYSYRAFKKEITTKRYLANAVYDEGKLVSGTWYTADKPFTVTEYMQVRIDPRGNYLHLRVAAIQVIDKIAYKLRFKPHWGLAEVCEFLANYPTT